MQGAFDAFRQFDFANADVFLWVFKRRATEEKFSARYVRADEELEDGLRDFAQLERGRITEWVPYSYLAQTHENGCLSVGVDDTNFSLLKGLVDRPEIDWQVRGIKDLQGAAGYLVKFVHDGMTVYAARRSPSSWKTAYRKKGVINVVFRDNELSASEADEFTIEPNFDLFCVDTTLFIASKGGFESVMQYKSGYAEAFGELQQQPAFVSLFNDMQPLLDYVGNNSTQLRRMAVIQEKNLYANPGFMAALRQVNAKRGWGINFDPETNQIVPSLDTAATILKVLLDQRLLSEITDIMYDVPDGVPVH